MSTLFIPVLLGTARVGRCSEPVAHFVVKELSKQEGVETQLIDVKDIAYTATTPPWGEGGADKEKTPWKEIMERADGLIIIVPEYNHGYPGELKLALDSLFEDYFKKPVSVFGVSAGGFGGTRVVDHIRPVLVELGMVPMGTSMYFSKAKELFDEQGNILDMAYSKRLQKPFEELFWYARVLKEARG